MWREKSCCSCVSMLLILFMYDMYDQEGYSVCDSLKCLCICLVSINYSLSWLMPLCGSVSWLGAFGGSRAEATPCNDDSFWPPSCHFYFFPLHFQSASVPWVREWHKRINLLWLRLDIRSNILWKAAETWVLTDQMGRGRRDLVVEFSTHCVWVSCLKVTFSQTMYIYTYIVFLFDFFFLKL